MQWYALQIERIMVRVILVLVLIAERRGVLHFGVYSGKIGIRASGGTTVTCSVRPGLAIQTAVFAVASLV